MKYWQILFFFISFPALGSGLDSLNNLLHTGIDDSTRFEVQNQIFQRLISQDIATSYNCLDDQANLLDGNSFAGLTKVEFTIDYLVNSGIYYNRKGEWEKALNNYNEARELALSAVPERLGTILNNIANIYYRMGDYHIALDYYLQSYQARKEQNDTMGIGMSLGNIGLIYDVQKDYEKAIEHYREAQTYFKLANNRQAVAWTYRVAGTAYLEMDHFDLALDNLHKSKQICEELSDLSGVKYCLLNLGIVYNDMYLESGNAAYLDSADFYLDQLAEEQQDKLIEVNYLNYKSRVHIQRKQYDEALGLLDKSMILLENSDMKSELKDAYDLKSQAYAGKGNYKQALDYFRKFKELNDEIFSVEKDKEMGRKQAEFEYNEKLKIAQIERENKEKIFRYEKRQQTLIIVVISLALILTVIIFSFFYRKKTRQTRMLKRERDEMINKYKTLEEAYNSVLSNLNKIQTEEKMEVRKEHELPVWVKKLSKRELEVLSCLSVGMTDQEIHEKLFISVSTVRTHCQRIYNKLLVKNRMEAANLVRKYGLI